MFGFPRPNHGSLCFAERRDLTMRLEAVVHSTDQMPSPSCGEPICREMGGGVADFMEKTRLVHLVKSG